MRSLTRRPFPLHTDCCFEDPPPQYFALYALRADRRAGGRNYFLDTSEIIPLLSDRNRAVLRSAYPLHVPDEFHKGEAVTRGAILLGGLGIRYRRECIIDDACTAEQLDALEALDELVARRRFRFPGRIPDNSALFVDNRRVLHGRTRVRDAARHLQRVWYC